MTNRHFGGFADLWKHLVLTEVLAAVKPQRYAETHAGSAAYPLLDDAERRFGVLAFREVASPALAATQLARVLDDFVSGEPALYPGSAVQAMTILGDRTAYRFCDLDPESVRDLRSWAGRLDLHACEVVERDGMVAVGEWLPDPSSLVVHIDPFDPLAHEDGAPSAVDLAVAVVAAGHGLVYWYGYDTPAGRAWAARQIQAGTTTPLWWGDFLITAADGSVRDGGSLGSPTAPGTGTGVVLANVAPAILSRCEQIAQELQRAYEGNVLPTGETGRLDWLSGTAG
jgi:hypothetical protein